MSTTLTAQSAAAATPTPTQGSSLRPNSVPIAAPTPALVAPGPAASVTRPRPSSLAAHWRLDPAVTYLNHGSYGATPRVVLDAQQRAREAMEADPTRFFLADLGPTLDAVRREVSQFVGCRWQDVAMVANSTFAVSTVLSNITLRPGDEVLASDHEYPACTNALRHHAAKAGARVVLAHIPFPIAGEDAAFDAIMAKVTPRTRVLLVSHVASPTGLIMPLERLVAEMNRRGIDTVVDGAHMPGMLDTAIGALNAPYYFANCHKWACAPKGAAFIVVREDKQAEFRPLALSVPIADGDRPRFLGEFDYIGGYDHSAQQAIGPALRFMASLVPGGWGEIRRRNHDLCLRGREIVHGALGTEPGAPDAMIGSMATILLPPPPAGRGDRPTNYRDALQDALVEKHRIQAPIWLLPENGRRAIRISAQVYNTLDQYEYLARALRRELDAERRVSA